MKKTIITLIFAFVPIFYACNSIDGYRIDGKIINMEKGKVVLSIKKGEIYEASDSINIVNGKFYIKGTVDEPAQAYMKVFTENGKEVFLDFVVENTRIKILVNYQNLDDNYYRQFKFPKIVGGANNAFITKLETALDEISTDPGYVAYQKAFNEIEKLSQNREKYKAAREALDRKYEAVRDRVDQEKFDKIVELIRANPDVEYAAWYMTHIIADMDYETVLNIFNGFTEKVKNSVMATDLREELAALRTVQAGMPAPDFTLKMPDGQNFTMSSLKGKVVLVDFWASWCGACRESMADIKAIYKDYKDRGFEIVGVANDFRYSDWIKAIEEENTGWIQTIDEFPVKNRPSRVATLYAIHYLPSYFLIDKEGRIVGKIKKENIRNTLEKLLK